MTLPYFKTARISEYCISSQSFINDINMEITLKDAYLNAIQLAYALQETIERFLVGNPLI